MLRRVNPNWNKPPAKKFKRIWEYFGQRLAVALPLKNQVRALERKWAYSLGDHCERGGSITSAVRCKELSVEQSTSPVEVYEIKSRDLRSNDSVFVFSAGTAIRYRLCRGLVTVEMSDVTTDIESVAQTGNGRRLTKVLPKRREFTPEIAAKSVHLFSARSITGAYLQPGFVDCNAKGVYRGALLTVWLKESTGDETKIEITKAARG